MRELPPALAAMGTYRQFIVYIAQPSRTRPGKTDKYPCDFRTGRVANAHDAAIWTDHATAIAAAASWGASYGIGFVFTEADPFFFVDLDDAALDDGSGWKPHAIAICNLLQGAAVEVSVSGKGLHIFGTGRPPQHGCESEYNIGGFYHTARYAALTGVGATGDCSLDCTTALPILVDTYWRPGPEQTLEQGWTDGPAAEWRGPADDDELIRRALRSQSTASAFGGKASFADLWAGNLDALSKAYPDEARAYNSSQADAALAQHLAFWTGNDCERISRLMGKSSLVRDKWEREDYLPRTILGAVGRQFEVLTDKAPEPVAGAAEGPAPSATSEPPRPSMVQGSSFVNNDMQLTLFAGCVYVQDLHRVLVPGGVMLKPEQFKVHFGGYTFTMDAANEKTTRDAWEAFTQSQAYRAPRADSPCFRPELAPGALVPRGGQVFVNTYWPVEVPRIAGDVTLFLTHLAKIIPNERDRYILICYMAACVQHQGHKFQWAPLIQGAPGNGKSLLSRCVAEAIGRRYVHWPKASKLAAQFNGWMVGKTFYAVEDIHVPGAKMEIIEELKPMITGGDGLEIESKGVDQISADICGNFMFNCNSKSDLPKTNDDRRYGVYHSAQQSAADVIRDGMGGDYFPKIYAWLRAEGYAIVSDFLWTFPIPNEFNPAVSAGGLMHRAPDTSSTAAAIEASRGGVEQEILEAIEQGLPGFAGGWISSIQLDRLLERIGAGRRVTHSKRKEMLRDLGYDYHPALVDGRVNNLVLPDGGKPRLFIHEANAARHIQGAAEAAKAYEQVNNSGRVPFPLAAI